MSSDYERRAMAAQAAIDQINSTHKKRGDDIQSNVDDAVRRRHSSRRYAESSSSPVDYSNSEGGARGSDISACGPSVSLKAQGGCKDPSAAANKSWIRGLFSWRAIVGSENGGVGNPSVDSTSSGRLDDMTQSGVVSRGNDSPRPSSSSLLVRVFSFVWERHPIITFFLVSLMVLFVAVAVLNLYAFVGDEHRVFGVLLCMAYFFAMCNLSRPDNILLIIPCFLLAVGFIPCHRKFVGENYGNAPYLLEFDKSLHSNGRSLFEALWIPVQFEKMCSKSMHSESCKPYIQALFDLGRINDKIVRDLSPLHSSYGNVLVHTDDFLAYPHVLSQKGFENRNFSDTREYESFQELAPALRLFASHEKGYKEFSDHESYGCFMHGSAKALSMMNLGLDLCNVLAKQFSQVDVRFNLLKIAIASAQPVISGMSMTVGQLVKPAKIADDWVIDICKLSFCEINTFDVREVTAALETFDAGPAVGGNAPSGMFRVFSGIFGGAQPSRESFRESAAVYTFSPNSGDADEASSLSRVNASESMSLALWSNTLVTFEKRQFSPGYIDKMMLFMDMIGANMSRLDHIFSRSSERTLMGRTSPVADAAISVLFPEQWNFMTECKNSNIKSQNNCKILRPTWNFDQASFGAGTFVGTAFTYFGSNMLNLAGSVAFSLGRFAIDQVGVAIAQRSASPAVLSMATGAVGSAVGSAASSVAGAAAYSASESAALAVAGQMEAANPISVDADSSSIIQPGAGSLRAIGSGAASAGAHMVASSLANIMADAIESATGINTDEGPQGPGIVEGIARMMRAAVTTAT